MKDYRDEARGIVMIMLGRPKATQTEEWVAAIAAALQAAHEAGRDEGLEEAARVVSAFTLPADWMRTKVGVLEAHIGDELAARIRALKGGSNG